MATSDGADRRREPEVLGSDEDYALVCVPCHNDGLIIPASGYCINCNEHLCKNCYNHHKSATLSKHHDVQGRDEMPSKQNIDGTPLQAVPTDNLTTPCPRHQTEMIKLFCRNHNLLICGICVALDNHTHCQVDYIPDISNTGINGQDYKDVIDDMDKLLTKCTNIKTNKCKKSLKRALQDVKKYRQETNKRMDKLQKEVERMTNDLLHRDEGKRKNVDTTCEDVISDVKATYDDMKQLNASKQANGLFIALIHARTQLQHNDNLVSSLSTEEGVEEYMFIPNQVIKDALQREEMIGAITKKRTPMTASLQQSNQLYTPGDGTNISTNVTLLSKSADDSNTPTKFDPSPGSASNNIHPTQLRPLPESTYEETTPEQSNHLTTSGKTTSLKSKPSFTRSKTTALNSKPLITRGKTTVAQAKPFITPPQSKSLTTSGETATQRPKPLTTTDKTPTAIDANEIYVKLSGDKVKCVIRGMTMISPDRLVLADSENNSIKLVDVTSKSITSQLTLGTTFGDKPRDITATKSSQVAVTVPNKQHIQFIAVSDKLNKSHIIQTDGKCYGICCHQNKLIVTYCKPGKLEILDMLGTVITSVTTDSTGKDVFHWPVYVQANRRYIYVSDESHEKVIMLDWQGKVTGWFRDLKYPRGLALLRNGSLLVCDRGRDTVCKISADCTNSTTILQNLRFQLALCVDAEEHTMYISRCSLGGQLIDTSILVRTMAE